MAKGKSIVITAYGHEKTIDKISVSLFDESDTGYGYYNQDNILNAQKYCTTINGLELKGDSWVFAKVVSENTQFALDTFIPVNFDLILKLDDRSMEKVMREVDSQELAMALKGESEAIHEKVFRNMSKRAAQMLKEDMEYMGPIRIQDVKEAQKIIIMIIHHLEDVGEIVISYPGETMI
jgi:hypothetical protein